MKDFLRFSHGGGGGVGFTKPLYEFVTDGITRETSVMEKGIELEKVGGKIQMEL